MHPAVKMILWIVGGLIVLLAAFGLGVAVGGRQAIFAGNFGSHYYRIFYGPPAGDPFFNPHGVVGQVIDIGSSTITMKDFDGDEHSVVVASGTTIREGDVTIPLNGIQLGDTLVVIGAPNASGQVAAALIRVLASSSVSAASPVPIPPPMPGTNFN